MSVGDFWSFWSLKDHSEIIVASLWVYEGPFSRNTHFANRLFNHFIKLRGELWADSVLLWGHSWHMKLTFGPVWGSFEVILGT